MAKKKFFDETKEQSIVKATIVEKYFGAWATIIISTQKRHPHYDDKKIGYIDLFAGPGRYKDGAISTPLRVLNLALEDENIRSTKQGVRNRGGAGRPYILRKMWKQGGAESIALSGLFYA